MFSFFVVATFLIALMTPVFESGDAANSGMDPSYILGDVSIDDLWNPTAGYTTNWTDDEDNVLAYNPWNPYPNAYDYVSYWEVTMLNVRNNTEYDPGSSDWWEMYYDFVCFKDNWGKSAAVGYGVIENATEFEGSSVYSVIYPGGPFNGTTAVVIIFDDDSDEDDVKEQLYTDNDFVVKIAWVTTEFDYGDAEVSWYEIAFKIITFQFNYTNTAFDFIMSAIINVLLAFVAFTLFTRSVHGGG